MSQEKDSDDLPTNLNLAELKEQLAQNGIVICPVQGCNQDFKSLWGLKYHVKRANHQDAAERKFKCEQCDLLFQSRVNLRQHRIADHSGSEGESPQALTSPLSSPRSRERHKFHFSSTDSSEKTRQMEAQNSCSEVDASSATNGGSTSKSEGNYTQATGVAKRKRGRPRKSADHSAKVKKDENFHLTSSGQSEVASETIYPSQNSNVCAINASSENSANARRTSTRVRTPRKNIFVYDDTAEMEKEHKGLKRKRDSETIASNKNNPKKRGRPRKNASAETVIGDSVGDSSYIKTSGEKRGRKQKIDIGNVNDDNVDDENNVEKNNVESDVDDVDDENDDNDDDDMEDDDDNDDEWKDSRKPSATKKKLSKVKKTDDGEVDAQPKKRGRKKLVLTESARLKRLVEQGQKLVCKNEGCRAKFTTANGYKAHQKICGVNSEEREKFTCEICDKVYISFPGLQYHMKVNHTESDPVDSSDHPEENNEKDDEPEILPSGRARRKAASRAISKVQQLATNQDLEEVGQAKKNVLKKEVLEQLITKIKGRKVSKEQEDQWTEALKTDKDLVCPCKGCSETFQSVASIKTHLESCEKAFSYKCLACNKVYLSIMVIHNHVNYQHVGFKPKGKDKSDSSDMDYVVVSSGESEDDGDEAEIEEIEESGSDLNAELEDCTDEIFVWDSARKKYKKAKKSKGSHNGGSAPKTGAVKFGPIGTKNSDAYSTTKGWREQEYKHKDLFPNLRPSASYWSCVDPSEIDQYVPEATTSPQFTIRRNGDNPDSEHDIQLPLFGSTSKDDSSVFGDVTFNVGGPVWAMAWCPVPDSKNKEEQFLAISTHRSWDEVKNVHRCVSGKGLIQLWNVGRLKVDSASSGSKPTLSLGIAHNYGAIWDISWCPSGTWEPASSLTNQEDGLPRLGVMAVACSDGCVRILSIPWPSALHSALDVADSNNHSSSYPPVIVSVTPHAVLRPCALGVAYNGECGQAWRAKWYPCSVHEKIATGFSDGTVAVWNLLTESPLLKETVDSGRQTFRMAPFLHITTNSSVVKDLAWCPQDPDHLVTGSYDRMYKIWNLKSPFVPVTAIKRGIPHEIHWSLGFGTIVSCEDDAFQNRKYPCIARYFTFVSNKEEKLTTSAIFHNSTIWTVTVSDWSKLLISGDAGGEVIGVQLKKKKKKAFPKFGIYRVYLEDLDKSPSSKKQELKKTSESENMTNSELLEGGQIETCIEEDINPGTSQEMESCTNKEIDASTSKETESSSSKEIDSSTSKETESSSSKEIDSSTSKETDSSSPKETESSSSKEVDECAGREAKDVTPPQSTAEVFQRQRLVFRDVNALEFQNSISNVDPEFKRLVDPSTMQSVPDDNFINPRAVHKVRFNPNKQSFTWLASGGAAGLARLHLVKQIES